MMDLYFKDEHGDISVFPIDLYFQYLEVLYKEKYYKNEDIFARYGSNESLLNQNTPSDVISDIYKWMRKKYEVDEDEEDDQDSIESIKYNIFRRIGHFLDKLEESNEIIVKAKKAPKSRK